VDSIAFRDIDDPEVGVLITINGRHLLAIVRDFEASFAKREGKPDLAGAYTYFGPAITLLPSRHFFGEPVHDFTDGQGRIFVLSCTCGIPGCWPLSARVEVREREIVWSDFRQPHRGPDAPQGHWRYDGLGPFVFNRQIYERALSADRRAA
jgi:hypothetical protein